MTCSKCHRHVASDHPECGGNPRTTCAVFGCGRKGVETEVREVNGTGLKTWLTYCAAHVPDEIDD